MRVVHSWLQDYIPFTLSPDELAERMSMLGLEIEGIERQGEKYRGFIVGRVLDRRPHPKADRLTVCTVDTGTEQLQVVCGAPNVAPGQMVALGLVGATVPRNQHDPGGKPFVLSRASIRGVESSGMICSAFELDLGDDADGILVLDDRGVVGQPLSAYLGLDDVAYDVEITANRPDWLSHIGVAREIAVIAGGRARLPRVRVRESAEPASAHLAIRVLDPKGCPRFSARVVRGVKIGPSPAWMQHRLTVAGLRPRNIVVDVTNYVMLECGQPLHAFDLALLKGREIIVRRAGKRMAFTTLDGKEHDLPADAVMVCDAAREVSIAGIMGGANSEISDATTDIVLESAYWNPGAIRRTRRALGIVTDASQRFERGADPNASPWALDRAAELIREHAAGSVLRGRIDVYPEPVAEPLVSVRTERVNQVLGTALTSSAVAAALRRLEFRRSGPLGRRMTFAIPTYRVDIEREIDLIEEVARVHGYDNIGVTTSARIDFDHPFPTTDSAAQVRDLLIAEGYQEAITYSLHSEAMAASTPGTPARLANQQNQEMGVLRKSLLPGLLDAVALNIRRGNPSVRLFEIGHVFSVGDGSRKTLVDGFVEEQRVALVLTGQSAPRHWSEGPRGVSVFDLKGDVADLLAKIHLDKCRFISYSTTETLAADAIGIEIQGSYAGHLGSVRSDVLKRLGIEQEVLVAELDLSMLASHVRRRYTQLPRFPRVRRDLAFVLDATLNARVVEETMREAGSELLVSLDVFDVYEGRNLPPGKKSIAFSLELMSPAKTLTEPEIDAEVRRITTAVERTLGATLRTV